jgi:hypothetical protein
VRRLSAVPPLSRASQQLITRTVVRPPRRAAPALFALIIAGCTGRGQIHFVSLNMNEIDPPAAKTTTFDAQEACWWIEANNELNIALRHRADNLLLGSLGRTNLALSLVLPEPPAGRARNYKVTAREARILLDAGLAQQRVQPYAGIIGLVIGDDGVLRGSYRLWAAPLVQVNVFSFLPQRPGPVLCFGTFEAVKDDDRGRHIREQSESGGHVRPPRTTRPAGQSTSRPGSL